MAASTVARGERRVGSGAGDTSGAAFMNKLNKIIARFHKQTILAVADLVADEFVFGEIARVSREAPVLILKRRESRFVPGGGANAIYNLRALGAEVIPVGIVDKSFSTTTKTRILAGTIHGSRQQVLRIDREPEHPPAAASRRAISNAAL